MRYPRLLAIGLLLMAFCSLGAQNTFRVKPQFVTRGEGYGYNFFTGPDASGMTTSILGFGSGLIDALAGRSSFDLVSIGTDRVNISTGLGFVINKYRFADNLMISLSDEGVVSFTPDPDPTHDYVNTFFGYGKAKLVTAALTIPLYLNVSLGEDFLISAGGFVDWQFFTKYKLKYIKEDQKVKELLKSKDMEEYPFNRFKLGVHAGIYNKDWEYGICATYGITPMFVDGKGPAIRDCHISFLYAIRDESDRLKNLTK